MARLILILPFLFSAASSGQAPPWTGLSLSTGIQIQSRPESFGGRLVLGYARHFRSWTGYADFSGYREAGPILGEVAPLETETALSFTAAPLTPPSRSIQFAAGAAVLTGIHRGKLIREKEGSDFGEKEYASEAFFEPALPLELRIHAGWFELRPYFLLAERSRFGLDLGARIPPSLPALPPAEKRGGGIGLRVDLLSLAIMDESLCEDDDCDSPRLWLAAGPEYHHGTWGLSLAARFAKSLEAGPDYINAHTPVFPGPSREDRYYRWFADFMLRKELGGLGLEAGYAKDLAWLSADGKGGRWMTGGDQYFRWGISHRIRRLEWGLTGFGISRIGLTLGARLFEFPIASE